VRSLFRLALFVGVTALVVWAVTGRPGRLSRLLGAKASYPNVLLVSIDSLRADHLGVYGYDRPTSPHLDALAADGIVFENAFSPTSWTLPAHVSLLTSLYPQIHGVDDGQKRLDERAVMLSETLQRHGYRTLAIVSAPFLESKFGYDQGFDLYDDRTVSFRTHEDSHLGVTTPRLHERAIEVLENEATEPFFLFLHYWDVHYDYQPPEPFRTRFYDGPDVEQTAADLTRQYGPRLGDDPDVMAHFVALYDGEIAFVDDYLGRLFDYLKKTGRYDDTLIIVTADHGEEFLEHEMLFHRWNLYDTSLRVPLIVKLPRGRAAGARVAANVGIVDVAPTILNAVGIAPPTAYNGRSLLPLALASKAAGGVGSTPQETEADDQTVYFADLAGKLHSVRRGRWKLIVTEEADGEKVELYDIAYDPGEKVNLAAEQPERAQAMAALYDRWLQTAAVEGRRLDAIEFRYDEALESALRSLGYVE